MTFTPLRELPAAFAGAAPMSVQANATAAAAATATTL